MEAAKKLPPSVPKDNELAKLFLKLIYDFGEKMETETYQKCLNAMTALQNRAEGNENET